jgi:polyribonucleotide 5'-hydroxyl-kinase
MLYGQVNIIVVLGSTGLEAELSKRFASEKTSLGEAITVVSLDKSDGAVERGEGFLQQCREAAIKEYFYGDARRTLSPQIQQVDFGSLVIYKYPYCTSQSLVSSSIPPSPKSFSLPSQYTHANPKTVGPVDADYGESLAREQPSSRMENWTMAVMHASVKDAPETVASASVMGFVYVADVDEERQKLRLLAPVGGRLGERPLVWGQWPEPYINLLG